MTDERQPDDRHQRADEPTDDRRPQGRVRALLANVSPYVWIGGGGLVLLVGGAILGVRTGTTLGLSEGMVGVAADLLRAVGTAALIGSVIGRLIGRRVQAEAFEEVMRNAVLDNALAALAGIHAPKDFTEQLRGYLAEMKRVTSSRQATFRLDWEDRSKSILRVQVELCEGGQNISSSTFPFRELWAPASHGGHRSTFEGITLWIARGSRQINFTPRGEELSKLVRPAPDGRVCIDLTREDAQRVSVDPEETYTLDQTFTVYLPSAWAYPLETFAAHPMQTLTVVGNAVDDLDVGAVLSNRELVPEDKKEGEPGKVFEVDTCAFPGQTIVLRWWPRPPKEPIVLDERKPSPADADS